MVRLLLGRKCNAWLTLLLALVAQCAGSGRSVPPREAIPPDLVLSGGRRLSFERTFSSEREVRGKPGIWTRIVDIVAGPGRMHALINPYSVAVDSRGRVLVTDPGAAGVHVFDFAQRKYRFLERAAKSRDPMIYPQCVAVDGHDNIYVTDSRAGKVFVFDAGGRFLRAIGSLKGGEGYFKRPTGIAIDPATQRIYVTDTLRNAVFLLDTDGTILRKLGKTGSGPGEFNYPTELLARGGTVAVVDAMNFRIQFLDRSGQFRGSIGTIDDSNGGTFRPKAIGVDSEGHYYVVEGLWGMVHVFDERGRLLYYFGKPGVGLGEFQLPTGLAIDGHDQIFVVDSFNRRVQVFQYSGAKTSTVGGQP